MHWHMGANMQAKTRPALSVLTRSIHSAQCSCHLRRLVDVVIGEAQQQGVRHNVSRADQPPALKGGWGELNRARLHLQACSTYLPCSRWALRRPAISRRQSKPPLSIPRSAPS